MLELKLIYSYMYEEAYFFLCINYLLRKIYFSDEKLFFHIDVPIFYCTRYLFSL